MGKLFDEKEIKYAEDSKNAGKRIAAEYKLIPQSEFVETHEFMRSLWQVWNLIGRNTKAGVGILLSLQ